MRQPRAIVALLALALAAAACAEPAVPPEPVPEGAVGVGESRELTLRFLRFDVSGFEQRLEKEDLLSLPRDVQDRLWLLDLDLTNGPNAPHLVENTLTAIAGLDPQELEPASRNMQQLLVMTPDTAELSGTSLEDLIDLAALLGVAPPQVLADLLQINVEDTFLPTPVLAETILEQVIATHPNAQVRKGPRTPDNPEGLYPVSPGSLPLTLADAASDFSTLEERFGAYAADGAYHPGFLTGVEADLLTDEFAMTVRANANALPYKGVDLTDGTKASVNSVPSQIQTLFDFTDPNWLTIEGLVEGDATIRSMTFRVVEDDAFAPGGRSPLPRPQGSSPAWQLPPWTLERVLLGASLRTFEGLDSDVSYTLPDEEEPVFTATVREGWQQIEVEGGVGSPPPPSYLWDLLLEVGQSRLHAGGIPEGEADVEFTLQDVPVGVDTEVITRTIRQNLESNPAALLDVATELIDSTSGAADFYYYRADPGGPPELRGDWLFFVAEADIPTGDSGEPARPYGYDNPGFFADEALTEKVSAPTPLDGDRLHEKVRVRDGLELYVEDDEGQVFRLEVGAKPSRAQRRLRITRVR